MTQIPLFQNKSEWLPPDRLLDFSDAKEIAIDLETYDPNIKTLGAGWARKDGRVIGVAIAVDGWKGYFPIAHEGGGNFDEKFFKKSFQEVLDLPCDKIFHNAMYDVGWLRAMGMKVNGRIIDTMIAAPLINENRFRYSLNELSKDYLQSKKSENDLYEAAGDWGVDAKSEMYKLPPMHVGPYAEQDADLTLRLWNNFKIEITKQELNSVFDLETSVFPMLLEMRWKGVRVDIERAEKYKKELQKKEKKILSEIKKETGVDVQLFAAASVAKAFDAKNIGYSRTETGMPRFDKNFLSSHPSPLAKMVVEAREINKARTTFLDTILKHERNGRIHGETNQLRSDSGGTVTGRLSMQNPNLQQVPARNKLIGPMIRSLFIPEDGCEWGCFDYNQQEPRLVVHFAALTHKGLPGASGFVEAYNENKDTDFHQLVADIANIPRKQAKTINLGLFYGMGRGKLGSQLGLNEDESKKLFDQYHSKVPFVKSLLEEAMKKADDDGVVRTLLGRKCRFDLWVPNLWEVEPSKSLPRDAAEREYGKNIKRSWTYKALNKIIQGSAADQTKKAMLNLYENGYIPHIQVHDELDFSVESEKQEKEIKEIMESCLQLEVPSVVDVEKGKSWGEIK